MGFPYWGNGWPLYIPEIATGDLGYWGDGQPVEIISQGGDPGPPANCSILTTCEDIAGALESCVSLTACEDLVLLGPADCQIITTSHDLFEVRPEACVSLTTCQDLIFDGGDFFLAF